jgi:hypothetical protein
MDGADFILRGPATTSGLFHALNSGRIITNAVILSLRVRMTAFMKTLF